LALQRIRGGARQFSQVYIDAAQGLSCAAIMTRILLAAWFSLLLIGMQQQVVVHEVDHLRAKVQRGSESALQQSADGVCIECALLAGAGSGVAVGEPSRDAVPALDRIAATAYVGAPAHRAPVFYNSRAPPIHLL
jgi:hypothetical protein